MTTKQIPEKEGSDDVFVVYKRPGETPLQCLNRLRIERPQYAKQTLSYAGRLDPLAAGLLLVLAGTAANTNRESYLGLEKKYEVEVLIGVSTDTYDILGLVRGSQAYDSEQAIQKIKIEINDLKNFEEMEYPPYSSKPVNGKSLFQWAREGRLDEISLPKQEGKIRSIELMDVTERKVSNISNQIKSMIAGVSGDFRQQEILSTWNTFFNKKEMNTLLIAKIEIVCQSGVYMRSFAHRLGEVIGIPALALTIVRTKIGDYSLDSLI